MGCVYCNRITTPENLFLQRYFSIALSCSIPMLLVSKAEFQVHDNEHIIMSLDVEKNMSEMGITKDPKTLSK